MIEDGRTILWGLLIDAREQGKIQDIKGFTKDLIRNHLDQLGKGSVNVGWSAVVNPNLMPPFHLAYQGRVIIKGVVSNTHTLAELKAQALATLTSAVMDNNSSRRGYVIFGSNKTGTLKFEFVPVGASTSPSGVVDFSSSHVPAEGQFRNLLNACVQNCI